MSIKTSLLTIISVVATAAAATLPSFDAKKLDAAFLPWLFLLRLKRHLALHRSRKRNRQIPSKLRLGRSIFAGMNTAEHIQQTMRALAQFLIKLGKSTGICIVSMAMLTMPVDVNAQVQPTPEIILYGTDTVRKHTYDHVAWGIFRSSLEGDIGGLCL